MHQSIIIGISTIISRSPNVIIRGIASRVKDRCLEKNLTQKAFAKRAGISYDVYRRFENIGEPSFQDIPVIANEEDLSKLRVKEIIEEINKKVRNNK